MTRMKIVTASVWSLAMILVVSAQPAWAEKVTTTRVAPGVEHKVIRQRGVPRVIHVIKADITRRPMVRTALARKALVGVERTSSIARRHKAVAAINGDFFRPSGRPVSTFARDRRLIQTPLLRTPNFAIADRDASAYVGWQRTEVHLRLPSSDTVGVYRVNQGRPRGDGLALFTPPGSRVARPPKNACAVRLRPTGSPTVDEATAGFSRTYEVRKKRCRHRRLRRAGNVVLASRRWGPGRKLIRSLTWGQEVEVIWSLGWPHVSEAIGGNPTLIRNGKIVWSNLSGNHYLFRRHPRTAVAATGNGKVMFVTVDGRRPRYSRGMKLRGFARLLKSLGAEWALNLDGGGSTTMYVRGKVVNRPSDGRERPVASALMIVMGKAGRYRSQSDSGSDPSPLDDLPDVPEMPEIIASERAAAQEAATDPASVGGLSAWLDRKGRPLPRGLKSIARRFEDSLTRR